MSNKDNVVTFKIRIVNSEMMFFLDGTMSFLL